MKSIIFNITSKDKLKYLYKPLLFGLLFDITLAFVITYFKGDDYIMFLKLFVSIVIGQSFLFNIPLLIFFLTYFKKDKHTMLTVENNGGHFVYKNKNTEIVFTESDIKKVIMHLSPPLYDKRATWLYWDDYFYYEIITTKDVLKIGCLVINNLEEFIKEDKIARKKVYFPLMK